jgi:hypothetical protein
MVAAVIILTYAWWAAGVRPFTTLSYVLVAIPSILAVVTCAAMGAFSRRRPDTANYYRMRAGHPSLTSIAPWLAVLICATVLEDIGLALGGRSQSFPTLSTAVDHLLATRWERSILYILWLLVGTNWLWRMRRELQESSR